MSCLFGCSSDTMAWRSASANTYSILASCLWTIEQSAHPENGKKRNLHLPTDIVWYCSIFGEFHSQSRYSLCAYSANLSRIWVFIQNDAVWVRHSGKLTRLSLFQAFLNPACPFAESSDVVNPGPSSMEPSANQKLLCTL